MAFMQQLFQQRGGVSTEAVGDAGHTGAVTQVAHPLVLATMVAIGIGMHNLGEGLAIGSSFALGELSLGIFLVVGFMIHNISEGLGIAVPAARSGVKVSVLRVITLTLVAGGPAVIGVWVGRYITNDLIGVLFFALAVGAATHVVVEVLRHTRTLTSDGRLFNGWSAGGFIAGVAIMYLTGVMVG
jgi:zinc transporter ZupT